MKGLSVRHILCIAASATLLSLAATPESGFSAISSPQPVAAAAPAEDPGLAEDIKVDRKVAEEIEKTYKLVKDPELQARLDAVAKRLVDAVGDKRFPFTFQILDKKIGINAFALPGGHIYVGTALLDIMRTDHELAAVLSHEMAHVINRHSRKQQEYGSRYSWYVLAALLLTGDSGVAMMGNLLALDKLNTYGIELEKEADRKALDYLGKAGYDPVGLLTFLEQLSRTASGLIDNLGVYQTHPYSDERISLARQALQNMSLPITWRRASGRFNAEWRLCENGAEVLLDGKLLFKAGNTPSATAAQRAAGAVVSLESLLDSQPRPHEVQMEEKNGESLLRLRGKEIFSFTPIDAALNGGSLQETIRQSVDKLKNIIWAMSLEHW